MLILDKRDKNIENSRKIYPQDVGETDIMPIGWAEEVLSLQIF